MASPAVPSPAYLTAKSVQVATTGQFRVPSTASLVQQGGMVSFQEIVAQIALLSVLKA
jgi:hypothetical protein